MRRMRRLTTALALSGPLVWMACGGSVRVGESGGTTGAGGASPGSTSASSSGSAGASSSSSSASGGGGGPACAPTCSGAGCCMLVKHFGGPGTTAFGEAIVADRASGDIVVGGVYQGTLDLGMGPLPSTPPAIPGSFLARFDTNGSPIWTKGWIGGNQIRQIVSAGPDLLVGGSYLGPLASGCGAGAADSVPVVKLAGDGTCLWSRAIPASVSAVAVDGNQDVVIVGEVSTSQPPDFGCGPETTKDGESFVAKLHGSDGSCVWSHLFPSQAVLAPQPAVAVDASSSVYVGGVLAGTLGFGGQTLASVSVNGDALLLKYDGQGNEVWARTWGSSAYPWTEAWVDGIAITKDQRVWIAGAYNQGVTFGSQAFGEDPFSGFVAGLTPDGDLVGAISLTSAMGTAQHEGVMVVDSAGALVTTRIPDCPGGCKVTVGGDVLTGWGLLMATLDPAAGLAPKWAKLVPASVGGDGVTPGYVGMPLAIDGCDNILLTGGFSQAMDLGCGPMTPQGGDFFFARLGR